MINVHAPSGTKKLKDNQRRSLLTSLLQSNSQARPGLTIGNVQFLIGGDMNTAPILMSQLLQACRDNRSLHTEARTHETDFAKHGDLCIAGGIQASTLKTTAPNHDPKHDPYGMLVHAKAHSAILWIRYRAILASTDGSVTMATSANSAGIGLERTTSSSSKWVCYRATLANTSSTT